MSSAAVAAGTSGAAASSSAAAAAAASSSTAASASATAAALSVPADTIPVVQNIVATCNLGCPLDLRQIAMKAKNAEYTPKRFAAVIMRIRDPKTTALIFSSGKMVITGAKSETDSKTAARKYARIVQKVGFAQSKFREFKIQNMVGSTDCKFPVQLEKLSTEYNKSTTYEPELFPGLIFRMFDPKVVLLIFVSGKIVMTGARTRDDINQAFSKIYLILQKFRKPMLPSTSLVPQLAQQSKDGAAGGSSSEQQRGK